MKTTVVKNLPHWRKPVLALAICAVLGGCATTGTQSSTENSGTQETPPVVVKPIPSTEKPTGGDTAVKITPQPTEPQPPVYPGAADEKTSEIATLLGRDDIKDEKWLLSQDSSAYTIQLVSAAEIATVKKYLPSQTLSNAAVFKKMSKNKELYVLVYGIYSSASEVTNALKQLPSWVKGKDSFKISLKSVQASITER